MNNYVQLGTYKTSITNLINTGCSGSDAVSENKVVVNAGDPIIWRIVRIKEDGSIRLIAEHNVQSTVIYNSKEDPEGKNYINLDGTNSEVKQSVDNWYKTNITESNIDNKVQIGSFCNDITGFEEYYNEINDPNYDSSSGITNPFGNAYRRLSDPSFKCPNGAIIINEKSGIITSDEVTFTEAGRSLNCLNSFTGPYRKNTYLANDTSFWTMSPHFSWAMFGFSYQYNTLHWPNTNPNPNVFSARAVIDLKADTLVTSGTGTESDPYVIG